MASPGNNNSFFSPPIPNRPNPKPRNSEVGDPLRRSLGGNPFPANSKVTHSDFSQRNSFGCDKENKTKAVPTPKGSKNFMSPTISAVSKINSSPRKRVLSDKNEISQSFSDVKGLILEDNKRNHHRAKSCVSFSDVIHTICVDEKKQFEESHDMTVTDFDEKEVFENKGVTYSDPRFRISPRPSAQFTSPEFVSREVDALLPPYDPKKNYLSPRPQFLHYKPNPRIEKRFDECKQLEELFTSEDSSSDTELSVEESEKCEEQEKELFTSEDASSDTELSVEESEKCEEQEKDGAEAVVEDETEDVEQLEVESDEEMVCESVEETSEVPTQSGFRKFKFLGWFLVLTMACLLVSATFSPQMKSTINEFHIPKEITEFAKANNLDKLSEKLWTLTESSLVYVDKLISRLGGGNEEYGPLQFHNLTYTLEDNTVFKPTNAEINEEPLQEKSKVETNLEDVYGEDGSVSASELESGGVEKPDGDSETNESDEQTEMRWNTAIELNEVERNLKALFENGVEWNIDEQRESEVSPEEKEVSGGSESEEKLEIGVEWNIDEQIESEVSPEEKEVSGGSESEEKLEISSTKDVQEEPEAIYMNQHDIEYSAINVHQHIQNEVVTDAESQSEESFAESAAETSDGLHLKARSSNKADNDLAKADVECGSEEGFREIAAETSDDLHPKVRSSNKADNDSAKTLMIVLSSAMLVLLAVVAYLFTKAAKPVAAYVPEPATETIKELNLSHVPVENLIKEKLSTLDFEEEEVDDRMSNSYNKKSSFHKEPQSGGGKKSNSSTTSKLRRESMASSASEYSVASLSYGSFTTYEKIPIKSGAKEEEMITPVRRSSRIKNKPSGL